MSDLMNAKTPPTIEPYGGDSRSDPRPAWGKPDEQVTWRYGLTMTGVNQPTYLGTITEHGTRADAASAAYRACAERRDELRKLGVPDGVVNVGWWIQRQVRTVTHTWDEPITNPDPDSDRTAARGGVRMDGR